MRKILIACMFLVCAGPCDAGLARFITKNDFNYFVFLGLEALAGTGFTLGAAYSGYKTVVCAKKVRRLKRLIRAKRQALREQRVANDPVDHAGYSRLLQDLKKARRGTFVHGALTAICPLGACICFYCLYHSWLPKWLRDGCRSFAKTYRDYVEKKAKKENYDDEMTTLNNTRVGLAYAMERYGTIVNSLFFYETIENVVDSEELSKDNDDSFDTFLGEVRTILLPSGDPGDRGAHHIDQ